MQANATNGASTQSQRYYSLDALRAIALLLGLVLHTVAGFVETRFWPVSDMTSDLGAAFTYYGIHLFRMTLFFMVAGFFARFSLKRRGGKAFAWDRFKRIFLVLVVAWVAMIGIVLNIVDSHILHVTGAPPPERPAPSLTYIPMIHLWFLYLLCIFYVTIVPFAALLRNIDANGKIRAAADTFTAWLFTPMGALIAMVPTAIALMFVKDWIVWNLIPAPVRTLLPEFVSLLHFGLAFGLGWMLNRQPQIFADIKERWPTYLAIGLIAAIANTALLGIQPTFSPMPDKQHLLAWTTSLAAWGLSFAGLALCLKFLERPSVGWRYAADASYWVYLIHIPIVLAMQAWVYDWNMHPWLKILLILSVTVFATFLSYHLLARSTPLGAWLNGRKRPFGLKDSFSPPT